MYLVWSTVILLNFGVLSESSFRTVHELPFHSIIHWWLENRINIQMFLTPGEKNSMAIGVSPWNSLIATLTKLNGSLSWVPDLVMFFHYTLNLE